MNQIFSFKRFLWLLKRQWFENATLYKWGLILIPLITGLLFVWAIYWDVGGNYSLYQRAPIFALTLLIIPLVYMLSFFGDLRIKSKGMFYFSLPVSPLERIVVAFTFTLGLLVISFVILTIFDFIFVPIFNQLHETSEKMLIKTEEFFPRFLKISLGFLPFGVIGMLASLMNRKIEQYTVLCFMIFLVFIPFSVEKAQMIKFFEIYPILIPVCWVYMFFAIKRKEV